MEKTVFDNVKSEVLNFESAYKIWLLQFQRALKFPNEISDSLQKDCLNREAEMGRVHSYFIRWQSLLRDQGDLTPAQETDLADQIVELKTLYAFLSRASEELFSLALEDKTQKKFGEQDDRFFGTRYQNRQGDGGISGLFSDKLDTFLLFVDYAKSKNSHKGGIPNGDPDYVAVP